MKEDIECQYTQKLLARIDEKGIWLYCKMCRTEHCILWHNISQKVNLIEHKEVVKSHEP